MTKCFNYFQSKQGESMNGYLHDWTKPTYRNNNIVQEIVQAQEQAQPKSKKLKRKNERPDKWKKSKKLINEVLCLLKHASLVKFIFMHHITH
jgi:hypothetical protein